MIVIPMAGLSRRFTEAGYNKPKYMLDLDGESVFEHAIKSFGRYFSDVEFIFIARDVNETEDFINQKCKLLNIKNYQVSILNHETRGQAETVELGLTNVQAPLDLPITIFNIDTFRPDFDFPQESWFSCSSGYLEVFEGQGANWSYVGPSTSNAEPLVERTTEKNPISNLCCNGLYHFSRHDDFRDALSIEKLSPTLPELYIAPLYNHLIKKNKRIHYRLIDQSKTFFCGTPLEFQLEQNRRSLKIF